MELQEWVYSSGTLNVRGVTHPLKKGDVLLVRRDAGNIEVDGHSIPLPTPDNADWDEAMNQISFNHGRATGETQKFRYTAVRSFALMEREYGVNERNLRIVWRNK